MGRPSCSFLGTIRSISISLLILVIVSFLHIRYGIPNECEMTWSQPVFLPIPIVQLRPYHHSSTAGFSTAIASPSVSSSLRRNQEHGSGSASDDEGTANPTRSILQRKRTLNHDILNTTIYSSFSYKYTLYRYANGFGMLPLLNPFTTVPILFVPGHSGSYKQVRSLGATMISTIQTEITKAHLKHQYASSSIIEKEEAAESSSSSSSSIPTIGKDDQAHHPSPPEDIMDTLTEASSSSPSSSSSPNMVYFTVDFNEESTAIIGHTILDQAEFVNDAIEAIQLLYYQAYYTICVQSIEEAVRELSSSSTSSSSTGTFFQSSRNHRMSTSIRQQLTALRSSCPSPSSSPYTPPQAILVGHSMGGFAIRISPLLSNYPRNSVQSFVTIATPHSVPPVQIDTFLVKLYAQVNTLWNEVKTSIPYDRNSITDTGTVSFSTPHSGIPTPPVVDIVKAKGGSSSTKPKSSLSSAYTKYAFSSSFLNLSNEQRKQLLHSILRNISVISISSGETDWQIWEPTTLLDRDMVSIRDPYPIPSFVSVSSSSSLSSPSSVHPSLTKNAYPPWIWLSTLHIPSLLFPIDHLAVLWCGQFIRSLSYSLYTMTQKCPPSVSSPVTMITNCTPYDRIDYFINTVMQYTEKIIPPTGDGNNFNFTDTTDTFDSSLPVNSRKQYHNADEDIFGVSFFLSLWSWVPFSHYLEQYILIGSGINPDLTRMSVAGLLAIVPIRFASSIVVLGMFVLIIQWLTSILVRIGYLNRYYKDLMKKGKNKDRGTTPSRFFSSFPSSACIQELTYQPWMHVLTLGSFPVAVLQPLGYLGCVRKCRNVSSKQTLCNNLTSQFLLTIAVSSLGYLAYISFRGVSVGGAWSDTVTPIFPFLFSIFMLYTILPLAYLLTWIIGMLLRSILTIVRYPFVTVPLIIRQKLGKESSKTTVDTITTWFMYSSVVIIPCVSCVYAFVGYERILLYLLQPWCTWLYLLYVIVYNTIERYVVSYGDDKFSFFSLVPIDFPTVRETFHHYPHYLNISSLPGYTDEKNTVTTDVWKLVQFSLPIQTGAFVTIVLFVTNILYVLNIIVRWTETSKSSLTDDTPKDDTSSVTGPSTTTSFSSLRLARERSFTDNMDTSTTTNGALLKGNYTNISINTSSILSSTASSNTEDTPRSRQRRAESLDLTPRSSTRKMTNTITATSVADGKESSSSSSSTLPGWVPRSPSLVSYLQDQFAHVIRYIVQRPSFSAVSVSTMIGFLYITYIGKIIYTFELFFYPQRTWSGHSTLLFPLPSRSSTGPNGSTKNIEISPFSSSVIPYASSPLIQDFIASFGISLSYDLYTMIETSLLLFLCPLLISTIYVITEYLDQYSRLVQGVGVPSVVPSEATGPENLHHRSRSYLHRLAKVSIIHIYNTITELEEYKAIEASVLRNEEREDHTNLLVTDTKPTTNPPVATTVSHHDCPNEECVHESGGKDAIYEETDPSLWKPFVYRHSFHAGIDDDRALSSSKETKKTKTFRTTNGHVPKEIVCLGPTFKVTECHCWTTLPQVLTKAATHEPTLAECGWGTSKIVGMYGGMSNPVPPVRSPSSFSDGSVPVYPSSWSAYDIHRLHNTSSSVIGLFLCKYCACTCSTCGGSSLGSYFLRRLDATETKDTPDTNDNDDSLSVDSNDDTDSHANTSDRPSVSSSIDDIDTPSDMDAKQRLQWLRTQRQKQKQQKEKNPSSSSSLFSIASWTSTLWRIVKNTYSSSVWLSFLPLRLPFIILRLLYTSIVHNRSPMIIAPHHDERNGTGTIDIRRLRYFINTVSIYILVSIGTIGYYIYAYGTMNASHLGNSVLFYVPCLYVISMLDYYGLLL